MIVPVIREDVFVASQMGVQSKSEVAGGARLCAWSLHESQEAITHILGTTEVSVQQALSTGVTDATDRWIRTSVTNQTGATPLGTKSVVQQSREVSEASGRPLASNTHE